MSACFQLTAQHATSTTTSSITGRVLCVEDDEVSYLLVDAVLQAQLPLVALSRASNAAEAIRLARSFEPDLMLLDMRLPDRSGIEVIRELNPEISAGAFDVIVVTADQFTLNEAKAHALGARGVLYKPIQVAQFLQAVSDCLIRRGRRQSG